MRRTVIIGTVGGLVALLFVIGLASNHKKTAKSTVSSTTIRPSTAPILDPASVRANELGMVPVIMYHRIIDKPTSGTDVSPQAFKTELETLAKAKFVPVTAAEFVSGTMDIPAGTHPVVLTFDDSTPGQLSLDGRGKPTSKSAVGIMQDVASRYPMFRPVGTFFVNRRPFSDASGKTLQWAIVHGQDIGNHTLNHPKLIRLSDTRAQREIAKLRKLVDDLSPGYAIKTIALPYGIRPKYPPVAHQGTWGDISYSYLGVFLAGSNPSHSPFDARFQKYKIPRIGTDAGKTPVRMESSYWLADLLGHPDSLYTSDGNPNTISFPASLATRLSSDWTAKARTYPDLPPATDQ